MFAEIEARSFLEVGHASFPCGVMFGKDTPAFGKNDVVGIRIDVIQGKSFKRVFHTPSSPAAAEQTMLNRTIGREPASLKKMLLRIPDGPGQLSSAGCFSRTADDRKGFREGKLLGEFSVLG